MSVTVNATGTKGHSGSGTSYNYTGLTVAAGSNTAIVLGIVWDAGSAGSSLSVTWGSQAMTRIRYEASNNAGGCELWGLAGEHGAVATGNQTLSISWTGTSAVFVAAMAFDGVNQAGGVASFPHATGLGVPTATPPQVSITSSVGNKVFACEQNNTGTNSLTGTQIYFDAASGAWVNASSNYDNGASSVTIGNAASTGTVVATDIAASAGVVAYSLACSAGSFSLSGQAAGLVRGRTIVSAAGTYTLAIADLVTRALGLSETAGAYSLSGQAAALTYSHVAGSTYTLACARGTYSFAIADTVTFGQNFVASGGTYALSGLTTVRKFAIGLSTGAYVLSGKDVALAKAGAKSIAATLGTYTVSGKTANLTKVSRYTLVAAPGSYSLSGKTQTIARTLSCAVGAYTLAIADLITVSGGLVALSAGTGVYSVNGLAAILTRTSLTSHTLACARGTYAFDIANVVTIDTGTTYAISCNPGSYTLAIANIVTIEEIPSGTTYVLSLARGAYVLSGAVSARDFTVELGTSSYALVGADSIRDFTVELGTGSYAFAIANLVSIDAPNATLVASGASYGVTGRAAAFVRTSSYSLVLNTGSYSLNGVVMTPAIGLPATTGTYALSGKAVTFSVGHRVSCATGSYLFAGQQALLNYSAGPLNRLVAASGAIHVTAGGNVSLTMQRRLIANTGAYAVTGGQPVNLVKASVFTLTGVTGAYAVVGPTTVLRFGRALIAARGTYTLTGNAAAFSQHRSYILTTDTGPYIVNGNAAALPPPPAGAGVPRNIPFIATMGSMTAR